MREIKVGFSTHDKAIGAWVIRKVLGRPFSHTYFKFKEDRFSDHTVFHAVGKGLIYVSEATFLRSNRVVAEFPLQISDALYDELMQDCHVNAGKNYGFLQNLGIGIVRLANKIGIKINKNPIDDGINCSEWMWFLLEEVYGKWTNTEPNLVAPDEVYDFLASKP